VIVRNQQINRSENQMTDHTDNANETNPSGHSRAEELRARFAADHAAARVNPIVAPEPPQHVRITRPGTVPEPEPAAEAALPEPAMEEPAMEEPPWYDEPPGGYVPPAVLHGEDDAFAHVAEGEGGSEDIIGTRVKLIGDARNGAYVVVISKDVTEPLSALDWIITGTRFAWVCWGEIGQGIISRIPYFTKGCEKEPKREELQPPKPTDPDVLDCWVNNGYLHGYDPVTLEQYTFIGSGAYARWAIRRLSSVVHVKRSLIPGAAPMIQLLSKMTRSRKNPQYKPFPVPIFPITDWQLPDGSMLSQPRRANR
jgi:hypothetical protein